MYKLLLVNTRIEKSGLSAAPIMRIPPLNLRVIKGLTDNWGIGINGKTYRNISMNINK